MLNHLSVFYLIFLKEMLNDQTNARRSLFPRVSYLTTAVFDGLVGVDTLIIQLSACGPVKDKPSGVLQKKTLQENKTGGHPVPALHS